MKAIRFDGVAARLEDVPIAAREGEALVRPLAVGICNTDLEITRGYGGFTGTLGHEFVGEVISSPDARQVGLRVVGEINCGCGACPLCRSGDARHCPGRTVLGIVGRDGAMAEAVSLPASNLLPVPDSVRDLEAVFVEPLAAACEILEQVRIDGSDRVALIGDGKLGLLIGQVLAGTGADVVAIGKHESKLSLLERRGVRTALACDAGAVGCAFDVVVEASGSGGGFSLAQKLVRPRGTIVLKSTIQGDVPFDAASLIINEVTLVGSRCGRFENALALLADGAVDVGPLVSAEMPLEDGVAGLALAAEPGMLKVILRP